MKKSLIVAGLLLAGSTLLADDANKLFIGIGTSVGTGEGTVEVSGIGVSVDADYDSIPLTLGYITSSEDRFKISYQKINAEHKALGETLKDKYSGFDFDYDWTIQSWKTNKVLPYVGVGIGFYKMENTADMFVDNEDLKGISYNLNAGILYQSVDKFEVELGYKFKHIKWQDIKYSYYTIGVEDDIGSLYLGLNYKF
jgi:opacity protein-like surface antigen